MSALVKKEVRLLLPGWIAAMLLAIVPAWISGAAWNMDYSVNQAQSGFWLDGLVPLVFALGVLFLGLSSFGQEFSLGTFTVLLSQPTERSRVWRIKIVILVMAFLSVWTAAVVSIWCQYFLYDYLHPISTPFEHYLYFGRHYQRFSGAFGYDIIFLTLAAFVVFSGGLWTTLLLRQIPNAFWFTLLTPLAIILGISSLLSDRVANDQSIGRIIMAALAVYSVAGFCVAALLFRRWQDAQWTGGEVSFPFFKKFAGLGTTSISLRPRHRFFALLWKEIQLHQVNILIAGLLLLLHLSSFIIRKIHPHFNNPDLQFVLQSIWLLWLLMPVLIGCSAIAEERRLGIMESQLTLPVSRRAQLLIKFFTALILSLFLGAAVPLLLERTNDLDFWLFAIVAGSFVVSFYASSVSRTVLQAIGLAIVTGIALYFYEFITVIQVLSFSAFDTFRYPGHYGLDLLKVYLGLPVLLLVFAGLTFWNYKCLRQNTALLQANFLAFIAVFAGIFLLTHAIYYRTWEYVTPTLPLRGPARLSDSTQLKLANSSSAIFAVLPDGRLWTETRNYLVTSNRWSGALIGVSVKGESAFVPGTDWAQAAANNFQALGISSDGSLWSIQRPWDTATRHLRQKGPFQLAQIGSDTNWSEVAGGSIGFLLLKKDGSLWTWGTNGFDWGHFQSSIPDKLKSDLAVLPARLGDQTNWTQLYSSDGSAYARDGDAYIWSWLAWIGTNYVSSFTQDYEADGSWSGVSHGTWLNFTPRSNTSYVGVKTDGTLWFMKRVHGWQLEDGRKDGLDELSQMGREAKWKAATLPGYGDWDEVLAIRSDGTLWNCNGSDQPIQLDAHSDWIALLPGGDELALASDGSLWSWGHPSFHAWLIPSRRPIYLGNIFQDTSETP